MTIVKSDGLPVPVQATPAAQKTTGLCRCAGTSWIYVRLGDDRVAPRCCGEHMCAKKLGDKDRHAIDLLLDRPREPHDPGPFLKPGPIEPQRMQSIEKILSLLDELPPIEPPADLARRTIRRIKQAGAAATPPPPQQPAPQRPHA